MIRFRTLGGIDLRRDDGRQIRSVLAQPRRLALLASLALGPPGRCVQRDLLVGRLWPEAPQDRARHSLNQALYQLRRSLGRRVVLSRGEEAVLLEPADLWCDAQAFEVALEEDRWEDALELYRGELLPGFFLSGCPGFESWLEGERDRRRAAAAGAAWNLAEQAEREGLTHSASSWGRRALQLSGEDETALQRLLRLLHRAGDRAGALTVYEAFVRRVATDPGVGPSPETQALVTEIRGPAPTRPATVDIRRPLPPLPRPSLPLLGREREMEQLRQLMKDPACRLVTVTGPGGVGKTRLALELAWEERDSLPDGVWFVSLAGTTEASTVPSTVLQALQVAEPEVDAAAELIRFLSRRKALLVLDNLEHIPETAPFLARLLEVCAELRLLLTSREVLRLRSEWVLPLEGLEARGARASDEEPGPAARLFLAVATRAGARIPPDPAQVAGVTRICRLVEGLPLAIELAAAWARTVTLEEIGRRIESSLDFLYHKQVDVPERHRSLRAAFEHSWALLPEAHRRILSRLSVFRGGFDLEAARSVAESGVEELAALLEKSLVRVGEDGRYELLEVTREFAAQKLAETLTEQAAARERHMRHYLTFLTEERGSLRGAAPDEVTGRCRRDRQNLFTAWRVGTGTAQSDLLRTAAEGLFILCDRLGWYTEGEELLRLAAGVMDDSSPSSGPFLARQAAFLLRTGRVQDAELLLRRALAHAREAGDPAEAAFALDRLGVALWEKGDPESAERHQREALALRKEAGDLEGVATSLNNLGSLAFANADHTSALKLCEECLLIQRRLGHRSGEIISLQNLGHISLLLGEPEAAEARFQESLRAARGLGHGVLTIRSLLSLGTLRATRGRAAEAMGYFRPALLRALEIGSESLALESILGTCQALALQDEYEPALELAASVRSQSLLDPVCRARAEQLVERLSEVVPAEVREAALLRGEALDLAQAAQRLSPRARG